MSECDHCFHLAGDVTDEDEFDVAYYEECCKCGREEWYSA